MLIVSTDQYPASPQLLSLYHISTGADNSRLSVRESYRLILVEISYAGEEENIMIRAVEQDPEQNKRTTILRKADTGGRCKHVSFLEVQA